MALRSKSKFQPVSRPAPHGGPVLFCSERAVATHWLRLIIAEKDIEGARVETVDARRPPEDFLLLASNPVLPTLADRDAVVNHAPIIAEYLDERYPHPPLMPTEPSLRAGLRMALLRLHDELFPLMQAGDARSVDALVAQLEASARLFPGRGWFLGLDYSLADCAWAALLWRLGQTRAHLPGALEPVWRYAQRCFSRDAFRVTL